MKEIVHIDGGDHKSLYIIHCILSTSIHKYFTMQNLN